MFCCHLKKKTRLFFQIRFRFSAKLRGKFRDSHISLTCTQPPPLSTSTSEWYICTIDEPASTCHDHPNSITYITAHSWCCTFDGFRQMYNNMYPSLWYCTEYFHCLKNPLCSIYTSLPPTNPQQPLIFFLSPQSFQIGFFIYTFKVCLCLLYT